MEGGNKQHINLEAPLDVSTSDMLVPIGQNTWQHNWQKWQGKCLPNSLRFEKNGWAAGWNVFDFDYNAVRVQVWDKWFGATQLNDNPSYTLGVYDEKDSANAKGSFVFTPESKLLSTNNCTASLSGDKIIGIINGKSFTITWDPSSETASCSGANVSMEYEQNADCTWKFTLEDTSSRLDVDETIWLPGSLNGTGLASPQAYIGYSGNQHSWGEYFKYNGSVVSAVGSAAAITPTVTDNQIKFSYDATAVHTANLSLILEAFYLEFDNLKAKPQTGDKLIIDSSASEKNDFNFYSMDISKKNLLPGEANSVEMVMKVPVWLTVKFDPGIDKQSGAKKPDNVGYRNIVLRLGDFGSKIKVKMTDAFGGTFEEVMTPDAQGYVYPEPEYRYNRIEIPNTIKPSAGFSTQRYDIQSDVWVLSTRRFENLRDESKHDYVQRMLGNIYSIKSCRYDANEYLAQNNWADWDDINNAVYTVADLKALRSLKKKDDTDGAEAGSDMDLVDEAVPGSATLVNTYVRQQDSDSDSDSGITEYNGNTSPSSIRQLFNKDGFYKGRTFEKTKENLTDGDDFWPFEYVPKCDVIARHGGTDTDDVEENTEETEEEETEEEETEETEGLEIIYGVYAMRPDGTFVTDLDEFKRMVLGEYDASVALENEPVKERPSYNIRRTVYRFTSAFDFDTISDEDKRSEWSDRWTRIYPEAEIPVMWEAQTPSDETYMDYEDIDMPGGTDSVSMILSVVYPGTVYLGSYISYTKPGVVVLEHYDRTERQEETDETDDDGNPVYETVYDYTYAGNYAVDTPNDQDVIIWTESGNNASLRVWNNHVEVSGDYALECTSRSGSLLVPEWKNYWWYEDVPGSDVSYCELKGYYGKNCSVGVTFMSASGSSRRTSGNVTSGSVEGVAKPKVNRTWASRIALRVEDGKVYDTAYRYDYVVHLGGLNTPGYVTWERAETYTTDLRSGISKAYSLQKAYDSIDGVIMAMPLWGKLSGMVSYNKISSKTQINNGEAFTFSATPNGKLGSTAGIWIDRTVNDYSYNWFKLTNQVIIPDSGDGTGYATLQLDSSDEDASVAIYYAKKVYEGNQDNYKEVIAGYYYPPVAGDNGNMAASKDGICLTKVTWEPKSFELPTSGGIGVPELVSDIPHTFYTDGVNDFKDAEVDIPGIDSFDFNTYTLPFYATIAGKKITFQFNAVTKLTISDTVNVSMANADVALGPAVGFGESVTLPIVATLHFKNLTGRFVKVSPDTLMSSDGDEVLIKKGTAQFTYSITGAKVVGLDVMPAISTYADYVSLRFTYSVKGTVSAVLRNVVNNRIKVEHQGVTYDVDVSEFLGSDDTVSVLSTDIREPDRAHVIGRISSSKEFQLVRQQWNTTVEVENFWWIDDTHILELNMHSWILKRKTDELDDWNGDRWTKVFEAPRTDILNSRVLRYMMTNSYYTRQHALMLVFTAESTYIIRVDIYDPRNRLELEGSLFLEVRHREIGQKLNDKTISDDKKTGYLNTYSVLNAAQLLSQAEWSATVVNGNVLYLGCHMSNNYDQWTAEFAFSVVEDTNGNIISEKDWKVACVIQGYGYVGIDGSLTGGEIPADYFDASVGFTGTVEDISVLSLIKPTTKNLDEDYLVDDGKENEINSIQEHVVGTAERQWYIKKQLHGIVSHITTSNGFKVHTLPMTNKYDAVYKSPSFYVEMVADLLIEFFRFADCFKLSGAALTAWEFLMGFVGSPFIFMFNPRYGTFAYLQQTLGQYAYVHYNSSESNERPAPSSTADNNGMGDAGQAVEIKAGPQTSPILSDEYSFGKQIVRQGVKISSQRQMFYSILFAAFAPALDHIQREIKINAETNQTATSDTGKKYSQMAMENLASLLSSSIRTESNDVGMSNQVIGIKSLDMFYSTSDKQQIQAGPGFVEHRFVADCVSQSVTAVDADGSVQQVSLTIKALTMIQGEVTALLEEVGGEALSRVADNTAQQMVCGTSLGAVAAIAQAGAYLLIGTAKATRLAYAELGTILDMMCQRGVTSEKSGMVMASSLSNEGKHKYGEKNETFMWPCWGVPTGGLKYTDETVNAGVKESTWKLSLATAKYWTSDTGFKLYTAYLSGLVNGDTIEHSSTKSAGSKTYSGVYTNLNGDVPFYQASCYGSTTERALPEDMACIQGVPSFLPTQAFKNENIGASDPGFSPSLFQDYIIDKTWNISQCATYGMQQWITCKDTKITNCPPSNMRINANFCGVATPYSAVEVKRGLSKAYMRPYAITPNVLALNCTGYNSIMDNKLYHAFDGMSYRIVEWTGTPGLMKQSQTFLYSFQVNDRFKRSNKFPANEVLGAFNSEPAQAIESLDKLWTQVNIATKEKGMEAGTIGEDKDLIRWAIPVFTEPVTTLPVAVKTMTAMPLIVADGVTCLVTDLYNNQAAYKAPLSVDFTIGKNVYRQTEEYISSVQTTNGVDIITDLVPTLGLKYIGSTPTEAYFYSEATRCYYLFTGQSLTKMDMLERFRDVKGGYWDFVNQEVVMPCLMTFKRLNPEVEDKDTETDNIIVPVMSKGAVSGELPPPLTTIFNDRSWYRTVSLPSGLAYQGPNRVIINRSVFVEYMLDTLKGNRGKWKRMNREKYTTRREYSEQYDNITKSVGGVEGWTYNPFLLVTSALGQSEDTDCLYEWVITFCWPVEMDLIYGQDNYAVVNITAETMTTGGKVKSRPTHVFLTKELFTRNGNYGYYSFRYQSKNGAGNRERLHIWCDQYIAVSSIDCESKVVTSRRTEILTQQQDVKLLEEL